MKKLPLGIQTFSRIIEEEMLYIDKTMYVQKLVESCKYVFLSRPRRFGKSLFISTLAEYFSGNKALFEGLALYNFPKWEKYPVIRLDFSSLATTNADDLKTTLLNSLELEADSNGIKVSSGLAGEFLVKLVRKLAEKTGERVVILIDEYDKPIVDNLHRIEIAEANREVLRNFYGVIKSLDEYIEFMFVTGVSKFAKVSIFSGLNQITDITLDEEFAGICGYTQSEFEGSFGEHIQEASLKTGLPVNEIMSRTKLWYNGYSWDGKTKLYNPFAVLSFFNLYRFRNFWFETGTPNYLMQLIKKEKYDLNTFDNLEISSSTSQLEDLHNLDLKSILFQTGYLTISQVILMFGMEKFVLDVPNYEVQNALYSLLFANLTEQPVGDVNTGSFDLIYYLNNEDIQGFTNTLKSLFARIPSNLFIEEEKYYHSLFIMMMYMSGISVESEINTNAGRIDGVIEFSDKIYIIELKHKKGAEAGLKQISDKKYFERYLNSDKKIILIGASFSRENIDVKSAVYKK